MQPYSSLQAGTPWFSVSPPESTRVGPSARAAFR